MLKGDFVEVVKIAVVEESELPTPKWDDYEIGQVNLNKSVPVEYTVTGYLHEDINLHKSILINRVTRNGITMRGWMQTSPIDSITTYPSGVYTIKTMNSYYKVTKIKEPQDAES